jgi:uncharacterized membrane protein YczE
MKEKGIASANWAYFLRRLPGLFVGLFFFALGIVMTLYADLGMAPWSVLQVGLTRYTPLSFGQVSQVVGLAVLVLGWLLGFPPGFGTVMNMYFVGYFMDLIMVWGLVPLPRSLPGQLALLMGGILVLGAASFMYLNPKLGAGPRDGLMMGLVQRLGRPVYQVRGAIEVTVLVLGYLLGGPVGVGTLITAFTTGYAVQLAFRLGGYDKDARHMDLYSLIRYLRGSET